MMKYLVLCCLLTISLPGKAQIKTVGRKVDGPITSRQGVVLKKGDVLRLGKGSLPSGWYKHIFTSLSKLDQESGRLDEGYAFNYATIREFREIGSGANRRTVVLVSPKGGVNLYQKAVDIESAMQTREVIAVNGVAVVKLIKAASRPAATKGVGEL